MGVHETRESLAVMLLFIRHKTLLVGETINLAVKLLPIRPMALLVGSKAATNQA